jgi:hypothetical protein
MAAGGHVLWPSVRYDRRERGRGCMAWWAAWASSTSGVRSPCCMRASGRWLLGEGERSDVLLVSVFSVFFPKKYMYIL